MVPGYSWLCAILGKTRMNNSANETRNRKTDNKAHEA